MTILSRTEIAPAGGVALWRQIADAIRLDIIGGKLESGDKLAGELSLAERFGVNRHTVRRALAVLEEEGVLRAEHGRGTFVATHAEQQVQYRFLRLQPDHGTADSEGPAQRDFVDCKRQRASAEVARLLGLRAGDPVLQARRLLRFSGVPTILEDIWLPAGPFKGLTAERLSQYHGPMYALFEAEFGVRMVRADEKLRAVLPDHAQATLLDVSPATPLLSVERIAYTYSDEPMELRRGLYRTDTHHYRNRLS